MRLISIRLMTDADAAERLHFTGNEAADALLARDPMALLIGFLLDQQVTVQKAFSGPAELVRRIGTLDASKIATMDPALLDEAFRRRPAVHRFPGAMAAKTRELCAAIVDGYGGDARRIWTEAADGPDLARRLRALPGMGEMKAAGLLAVLIRRLGVRPSGWEDVVPKYPTLGDVDSADALASYQEAKRAHKRELRERR